MVSLPSLLVMSTQAFEKDLHRLRTMKGHLSSYLTNCWEVIGNVGELPCPSEATGFAKAEKWGEILYSNAIVIALASLNLELLTNELREVQGRKPLDYSESHASQVITDWHQLAKEVASENGYFVTDEGRVARS